MSGKAFVPVWSTVFAMFGDSLLRSDRDGDLNVSALFELHVIAIFVG